MKYKVLYWRDEWVDLYGEYLYNEATYMVKKLIKAEVIRSKRYAKIIPIIFEDFSKDFLSPADQLISNKFTEVEKKEFENEYNKF